jgi:lysophospholipase L1-like esterase
MNNYDEQHKPIIAQTLLLSFGVVLILYALLYSELTNIFLWLTDRYVNARIFSAEKIKILQIALLAVGLVLISISRLLKKTKRLQKFLNKKLITNLLFCVHGLILPISLVELSIGPVIKHSSKTAPTVFVRDRQLGWRLRPNSNDIWLGVRVKINGKGLRGPELDYKKPAGVTRILYLGDSVTFGFKLPGYRQTFPYIIEELLEDKSGIEVETINTGVDGYSTMQEYIYLSTEGIKYNPDLVILSFVFNDVAENLSFLNPDQAAEQSYQLSTSRVSDSPIDRLLRKSAIFYAAKEIKTRRTLERYLPWGADEIIDAKSLVNYPHRPNIKKAWKITLRNVSKIFNFCRDREIPVILVIFPSAFQLDDKIRETPQDILIQAATDNRIPVIDLLPPLAEKMKQAGMKPKDLFLDQSHLTTGGSKAVSEIIADFILTKNRGGSVLYNL